MVSAISEIINGTVPDKDLESFLIALRDRGETPEEISGAAKALRQKALTIQAPADAIDCCGTGGDAKGTLNISTATAIVLAGCGVPVAKHGNRAASSKSGTMDALEELGVTFDASPETLEAALKSTNFCFLPATKHHSAIKHAMPARKKIGTRTIFNLLGPLANPAGTDYQLIGVFDKKWVRPMAEALRHLGTKRAWVVHGTDGMDEITNTGPTRCAILDHDEISEATLLPGDFDCPVSKIEDIAGDDPAYNAQAIRDLLDGQLSPYRDVVLMNAAAGLAIHSGVRDLRAQRARAAEAIDSGAAKHTLQHYIDFIQDASS